jgi:hypothetical protein
MTFVSGGDLKMTAAVLSSKENLTAVAEGNIVLQAGQSTETTKIGAAPTLLSHLQKEQAGYASSHESVTGTSC